MIFRNDHAEALEPFHYAGLFSIGTLGPVGTSSEQASLFLAEKILEEGGEVFTLSLYQSFDQVLHALIHGEITLAVIPNAYERINEYYINPETKLVDLFIYDTPSYGLAKRRHEDIPLQDCTIVTHPAPVKLVDFLLNKLEKKPERYKVHFVSSTSKAAYMVKNGEADLAITNGIAGKLNELEFISMYGAIKMSWAVFSKNNHKTKTDE